MSFSIYQLYLFVHKIPDYLFPGGIHAYQGRIAECKVKLVYEFMCLDLYWWRELFHLFGGILVLFIYHTGREYQVIRTAVAGFIVFMLIQEFVIHPVWYGQSAWKSISDVVFWFTPLVIYERKEIQTIVIKVLRFINGEFHRGGKIVEFIKSNILSIFASLVDFGTFSFLYYALDIPIVYSTIISASLGGLIFMRFAHSWVFQTNANGAELIHEMGRFLIVWLESIAWNVLGTTFLGRVLPAVTARIITALFVGWFWNFPLYKFFVFIKVKKLFRRKKFK